ncbi:MAG TPA: hypothetical protein DCQ52_15135, partial [Acidimicrobiaceae bacterium]|nr:hypothetical protein [Acidimicrobiaceae bacterium]
AIGRWAWGCLVGAFGAHARRGAARHEQQGDDRCEQPASHAAHLTDATHGCAVSDAASGR